MARDVKLRNKLQQLCMSFSGGFVAFALFVFIQGQGMQLTYTGFRFTGDTVTLEDGVTLDVSNLSVRAGGKVITPEVEAEGSSGALLLDGPASGIVRIQTGGANAHAFSSNAAYLKGDVFGEGGASDPINLTAGATIATGKSLAFANGGTIQADNGSNMIITGGGDSTDQLVLRGEFVAIGDQFGTLAGLFDNRSANSTFIFRPVSGRRMRVALGSGAEAIGLPATTFGGDMEINNVNQLSVSASIGTTALYLEEIAAGSLATPAVGQVALYRDAATDDFNALFAEANTVTVATNP